MRYPRKLPAGDTHRPEDLGYVPVACADFLARQIPPPGGFYFALLVEKPARPVKAPGPCWSLALLNRNGRRRRTVHAALTRPRGRAGRRPGPPPLFAIGEAAAAGRSPPVHAALMVTSACRATVGPRRRGQPGAGRSGVAPHWAMNRARPAA